jgi:ATP-dependent protease HslVU (ClpYQ) peptidase subunit
MTIAAGFVFGDGVLLCADSQFTVGGSKLDGMKLGNFEASWGQVMVAFAGDVDFAAAAFQQFERERESDEAKADPIGAMADTFEDFYRRHVLERPGDDNAEFEYSLLLAVRLRFDGIVRLYRTYETILREIKSFDCAGSGDDFARDILGHLHKNECKQNYAVALASYTLAHIKANVQYCGGKSVIFALLHNGKISNLSSDELEYAAIQMERVSCWFIWEAQKFMLGHTFGDGEEFKKRLEILVTRAKWIREVCLQAGKFAGGP